MAGLGKLAWRQSDREPFFSRRKMTSDTAGVSFGSLGRAHTQKHCVCQKIGKSKPKHLKLHTFRLTEWMTLGLVSCCWFFMKMVSSSHRCGVEFNKCA